MQNVWTQKNLKSQPIAVNNVLGKTQKERQGSRPLVIATLLVSTEKNTQAHYVAKIWKQAVVPFQHIDSFVNNGWLADGSIDRIDAAFPEELESIFAEKTVDASTEDDDRYTDVTELEDDDNLEDEEEEVDEENEDER